MTSWERFSGLTASVVPITMIVCDIVVGGHEIPTFMRWISGATALAIFVAVVWSDKRATMRWRAINAHTDQRRFHEGPEPKLCGCWIDPSYDVVFVTADRLYKCEACGMRWTEAAWDRLTIRIVMNQQAEREKS